MTRLPSMDLYNDAVQTPGRAFTDAELARGEVVKNGLGLPKPASGGFALTYGVISGSKTYAVRLFHRDSPGLERRYQQISAELARTASPYFVDFEFQPSGIFVQGVRFPVVKMAWASGEVLGVWVKRNLSRTASMIALRDQFRLLSEHLESRGIAHGDIQGGNVMVDAGARVRLIDYDGMWVPPMPKGDGEELGHIHFQHPRRERSSFGPTIDRFSFLVLELTLSALAENPKLFDEFNTGENLVLQQMDYAASRQSKALQRLRQISALKVQVDHFERICLAPVDQVPSLADFLRGLNIPTATAAPSQPSAPAVSVYRGPNVVLDASDYGAAMRMTGSRVELIGCVFEIKSAQNRYGRPYVFVNFGPWRGNAVKIIIWEKALDTFSRRPDATWEKRWMSVNGLVQLPHSNPRYGYTHIGVEIDDESEIRFITENEARFRIGRQSRTNVGGLSAPSPGGNQALIDEIRSGAGVGSDSAPWSSTPRARGGSTPRSGLGSTHSSATTGSRSVNQDLLDRMRTGGQPTPSGTGAHSSGSPGTFTPASTASGGNQPSSMASGGGPGCWGCLIPLAVVGALFILPQLCSSSKSRPPNRRASQPSPHVSEEVLARLLERTRVRQGANIVLDQYLKTARESSQQLEETSRRLSPASQSKTSDGQPRFYP